MNDYPANWPDIARKIKTEAGWKCEHCQHSNDQQSGHVLTVHHLDGDKANCTYNNLVALCQRCHLHIQAKYLSGQQWLVGKPEWAIKRNL